MKKNKVIFAALVVSLMFFCLVAATPGYAYSDEDQRPFHLWDWETGHNSMVNVLLISQNDKIVKHHERIVTLAKEYSVRDPLLNVYGLREVCDDSEKDAFLLGLKANNLIYLIHVSDNNPAARKLAIKELRLLAKIVHSTIVKREFPYWADLLEEGRYSPKTLSHIYVHYTVDVGNYFYDRMGVSKRFFYWLGFLINDFTIANMCGVESWVKENQCYLESLYMIRRMAYLRRSILKEWWNVNIADLGLKASVDKSQASLDYIKMKYMDREMGHKW